jgi:hypothetical protein
VELGETDNLEVIIDGTVSWEEDRFIVEVTEVSGENADLYDWIEPNSQLPGCRFADSNLLHFNPGDADPLVFREVDCSTLAYIRQ